MRQCQRVYCVESLMTLSHIHCVSLAYIHRPTQAHYFVSFSFGFWKLPYWREDLSFRCRWGGMTGEVCLPLWLQLICLFSKSSEEKWGQAWETPQELNGLGLRVDFSVRSLWRAGDSKCIWQDRWLHCVWRHILGRRLCMENTKGRWGSGRSGRKKEKPSAEIFGGYSRGIER